MINSLIVRKSLFILALCLVLTASVLPNRVEAAFNLDQSVKLAKAPNQSTIYYLDHKRKFKKAFVGEESFLAYGNRWDQVKTVSAKELAKWPEARLIKKAGSSAVYYINGKLKTSIKSKDDFLSFGFSKDEIITVNHADFSSYRTVSYDEIGLDYYVSSNRSWLSGGTADLAARYQTAGEKLFFNLNADVGDSRYAKGQKNIKLASFTVEAATNQNLLINRIRLTDSTQTGGSLTYSNGFNNLRATIDGSPSRTVIEQPETNVYDFSGFNYRLREGEKAKIEVYVDTSSELKPAQAQIKLLSVESSDLTSNQKTVVSKINLNGQKSFFNGSQASADLSTITYTPATGTNYASQTATSNSTKPISSAVLAWPVDSIRVNYGFRDPSYPYRNIAQHDAIDIDAHQGSQVKAAADGTVSVAIDNKDTRYNYVVIEHANSLKTVYGHLSQVKVKAGTRVTKGQIIALSGGQPGSIGAGTNTTGPHLHFEVWDSGRVVNPLNYLE